MSEPGRDRDKLLERLVARMRGAPGQALHSGLRVLVDGLVTLIEAGKSIGARQHTDGMCVVAFPEASL